MCSKFQEQLHAASFTYFFLPSISSTLYVLSENLYPTKAETAKES